MFNVTQAHIIISRSFQCQIVRMCKLKSNLIYESNQTSLECNNRLKNAMWVQSTNK